MEMCKRLYLTFIITMRQSNIQIIKMFFYNNLGSRNNMLTLLLNHIDKYISVFTTRTTTKKFRIKILPKMQWESKNVWCQNNLV